jgi:hypothetical protein
MRQYLKDILLFVVIIYAAFMVVALLGFLAPWRISLLIWLLPLAMLNDLGSGIYKGFGRSGTDALSYMTYLVFFLGNGDAAAIIRWSTGSSLLDSLATAFAIATLHLLVSWLIVPLGLGWWRRATGRLPAVHGDVDC